MPKDEVRPRVILNEEWEYLRDRFIAWLSSVDSTSTRAVLAFEQTMQPFITTNRARVCQVRTEAEWREEFDASVTNLHLGCLFNSKGQIVTEENFIASARHLGLVTEEGK